MKRLRVAVILLIAAAATAPAQQASNPAALPLQHMVFVIDNSGSMEEGHGVPASDPLRLRGVAASLVLDAAEVSSNVEAGLILFSDQSQTDGKLHSPDVIRQRLHAGRLPPADGGTNMYDALAKAIAMFAGSNAAIKRIVLITDGMPTSRAAEIIGQLVPAAEGAGIQIFAIGMSKQVDKNFLDAVTKPTTGLTLIAEEHSQLLRRAKELMGDRDNVFVIAEKALPASETSYRFTISPGVDRARITAILDHPQEFSPGELTLTLDGPPSAGERPYVVRTNNGDRIAAWTSFFSTPGDYTLRVESTNPGGHRGLRLFVEALSNLNLQLTLNPPASAYLFGSEMKVIVNARTASGTIAATELNLSGTVLMAGGGTEVITFNGAEGVFRVRDVIGRHTVIVKGATNLARAEARLTYQAIPEIPASLTTTPAKLDFIRALGPIDPAIPATFKLVPHFPAGARPRPLKVGFMMVTPIGEPELVAKGGGVIKMNGPALFTLPPTGSELTLRIKLDPNRPLPTKGGKYTTELRIYSNEVPELKIPCEYTVDIPEFIVRDRLKAFALWWDPLQPRTVTLGHLHSDLSIPSTFTITLPDELRDPNRGTKIADVALRIAEKTPESEPADAGTVRYGPIDLEPGKDIPLEIVITPSTATGWQNLPGALRKFDVDLTSSFGMQTKFSPLFRTLGTPFFGRFDRHGRPIVSVMLVGSLLTLLLLLTVQRIGVVRRFWRFRRGCALTLPDGPVQISDLVAKDAAALILPNSGSPIDDTTIGRVSLRGRQQYAESPSGHLMFVKPELKTGDMLVVSDDPSEDKRLWEIEYVTYVPREGGEIEIRSSPAEWTFGRVVRSVLLWLAFLWALTLFLGSRTATALAYHLKFIESFYLWLVQ